MTESLSSAPGPAPELSVVVTIVEAGVTLERCLTALASQQDAPTMEVLVPFDHITADVKAFEDKFPDFCFIDLGQILNGLQPQNALEEHKFYDARRSAALKMARGRLVSILEDRGVPAPDWAATMVRLHNEMPEHAAIGGAVELGIHKSKNWAAFICDFGRYQAPLSDDDPEYLSDTNICYKREALDSVREYWADRRFDEAQVNWALKRNGNKLRLCDQPRTSQIREPMTLSQMASERYHWGRNFGQSRVSGMPMFGRIKLCLVMPILPFFLYARHLRRQLSKGYVGEFLVASPVLFVLLVFWTFGEFKGYIEGTPEERFGL